MINRSITNGSNWSSLIKVGSGLHGICDRQQGYEMFPPCGRSDIDRPLWCVCSCGPVWVCGWLPFWRNCRQYRCNAGWDVTDHQAAVFDACLWHTKSEHPKSSTPHIKYGGQCYISYSWFNMILYTLQCGLSEGKLGLQFVNLWGYDTWFQKRQ